MPVYEIPAANQGWWTEGTAAGTPGVGVPGGLFQYLAGGVNDRATTGTVIDITAAPYNADNTGATSVRDAVAAAVLAASGPTVIYFPAGEYLFESGNIYSEYKDNITIRGAGPTATKFHIATSEGIFGFNSPGTNDNFPTPFTGTKTKGSTQITMPDASYWDEGMHLSLLYENETDDTRIIAGSPPTFVSNGSRFARQVMHKVTAKVGAVLTLDPPMVTDGTDLTVYAAQNGSIRLGKTENWGFEDFSVEWESPSLHGGLGGFGAAEGCWIYNVHFLNWQKNDANGSAWGLGNAYRCEVRKCKFHAETGSSDDGAIGIGLITSCLIVDNIFTGDWDYCIYANGNNANNAIVYNYAQGSQFTLFHSAHPSLNLIEGNYGPGHQSDGYHGSSSHNTIYRNWFYSGYPFTINRFKRNYVGVGNIFGIDGTTTPIISWGNPNIGNGAANGFAGPTGLSDQEGEIDYLQPGYSPNTYVIQASDIAEGDFWEDWKITGELITRISDHAGVFTVNKGSFQVGMVDTASSTQLIHARWGDDNTNWASNGSVTARTGMDVTVYFDGGTNLPDVGDFVDFYLGAAGCQERDLDTQASSTMAQNYAASAGGTGAITDSIGADTLPNSLFATSKPTWFGDRPWPAFDPNDYSGTADAERIPAGYRYLNGEEPSGAITIATLNVGTLNAG